MLRPRFGCPSKASRLPSAQRRISRALHQLESGPPTVRHGGSRRSRHVASLWIDKRYAKSHTRFHALAGRRTRAHLLVSELVFGTNLVIARVAWALLNGASRCAPKCVARAHSGSVGAVVCYRFAASPPRRGPTCWRCVRTRRPDWKKRGRSYICAVSAQALHSWGSRTYALAVSQHDQRHGGGR